MLIPLEKEERKPYHLHINVEVIEAVYYMCAMMLEIPVIEGRTQEGIK